MAEKNYQVELYYGYEEGECGIYHAFEAVAPGVKVDDDVIGERLAEQLDCTLGDDRFNYDCMYINLPEALVAKIQEDAIRDYLAKEGQEKDPGQNKGVFSVSTEVCNEIVDAALRTIRGVGVDMGSGCYDLNSFEIDGEKLNLYCDICKIEDTDGLHYAVYYAVEYDGGENLFHDWGYTEGLDVDELKTVVFEIANKDFREDILYCMGKDVNSVLQEAFAQTGGETAFEKPQEILMD